MTDYPDPLEGAEHSDFDLNFNGVGDWGSDFTPLPDGTYTVVVAEAKTGRSKNNNPKVTLTLQLDPNTHSEFANRKVWDDLTLTQGAMPRVKQALSAIMQESMEGKVLQAGWWNDLIGMLVKVALVQESYTNPQTNVTKINNKVKGYIPLDAGSNDQSITPANPPQQAGGFSL